MGDNFLSPIHLAAIRQDFTTRKERAKKDLVAIQATLSSKEAELLLEIDRLKSRSASHLNELRSTLPIGMQTANAAHDQKLILACMLNREKAAYAKKGQSIPPSVQRLEAEIMSAYQDNDFKASVENLQKEALENKDVKSNLASISPVFHQYAVAELAIEEHHEKLKLLKLDAENITSEESLSSVEKLLKQTQKYLQQDNTPFLEVQSALDTLKQDKAGYSDLISPFYSDKAQKENDLIKKANQSLQAFSEVSNAILMGGNQESSTPRSTNSEVLNKEYFARKKEAAEALANLREQLNVTKEFRHLVAKQHPERFDDTVNRIAYIDNAINKPFPLFTPYETLKEHSLDCFTDQGKQYISHYERDQKGNLRKELLFDSNNNKIEWNQEALQGALKEYIEDGNKGLENQTLKIAGALLNPLSIFVEGGKDLVSFAKAKLQGKSQADPIKNLRMHFGGGIVTNDKGKITGLNFNSYDEKMHFVTKYLSRHLAKQNNKESGMKGKTEKEENSASVTCKR